jgi:hypothetical protein
VTASVLRTGADHLEVVEPGSALIEAIRSRARELERVAEVRPNGRRRPAQVGWEPRPAGVSGGWPRPIR